MIIIYGPNRCNKNTFLGGFNKIVWNFFIENNKNNVNKSLTKNLDKVNSLIMSHAPVKKLKIPAEALVYYNYTKLYSEKKNFLKNLS